MANITLESEVSLEFDTHVIAHKIAALGSDEQASFFNAFFRRLKYECQDSPMGYHWQLSMIADELFEDVANDMKEIGSEPRK